VVRPNKKIAMIVGELEVIVLLDAPELGISQARSNVVSACPDEPGGRLRCVAAPLHCCSPENSKPLERD
jgi:hypothetical protein